MRRIRLERNRNAAAGGRSIVAQSVSGRSKSPVSRFITQSSPVEMSNQAPDSVSRPLPSRMLTQGNVLQIGDRIADRYAFERGLTLGGRHHRAAGHGLGRRPDQAHPFADEIAGRERRGVGVECGADAAAAAMAHHHDVLHLEALDARIPAPPRSNGTRRPARRAAPDWRRCARRTARPARRRRSIRAPRGNRSRRSPSSPASGRPWQARGSGRFRTGSARS